MTNIEKFELIKTTMADNEDIVAFCDAQIASIAKKAEKAKERKAAKVKEPDELIEAVFAAVTADFQTKEEVTARIEGDAVTVGKVTNRLSKLVKEGTVMKEKTKIDGKEVTVYKRA